MPNQVWYREINNLNEHFKTICKVFVGREAVFAATSIGYL